MRITYSECAFVALRTQHTKRMRHIVISSLPSSTVPFPPYHINGVIFGGKKWTQNMCFDILYKFYLQHFSLYEEMSEIWSKMYTGLHVKYRLFVYDFNLSWIFSIVLEKFSNAKFHENPSTGSRLVPWRQTEGRKGRQFFEKFSNTKFHENPSTGSRLVTWRQTEGWKGRQFFEKFSNTKFHENPSTGSRLVARRQVGGRKGRKFFEKISNTKFHENPSTGSRLVTWRQTEGRKGRHSFSKNSQMPNFMKIRPLVAVFYHDDRRRGGRAGMTKATVAFRNFAKAPNNFTENTTNIL